jgi:predicted amidohydrolase
LTYMDLPLAPLANADRCPMKKSFVVEVAFLALLGVLAVGCATGTLKEKTDDAAITPGGDTRVTPPGSDAGVTPGADASFLPQPDAALLPDAGAPPPPPGKDSGTPNPPPKQDAGTVTPPLTNKVAAIQYASGQAAQVNPACTGDAMPDVCALKGLVGQAVGKKASYVVLPEYGIDQDSYEPLPAIGDNPAMDSNWPADWVLTIFSTLAQQKNIYLVVNLITHSPSNATCTADSDCSGNGYCMKSGVCTYLYNTSVAMDNTGKVVGLHRKFNLFGGETSSLTAGSGVTQGVFQTPLGKMGMLIGADIYGSTSPNSQLAGLVDVVLVSSYWTTSNPVDTYYKNYLGKWPYYSVIANTTDAPGYGGGVFKGNPWAPVSTSDTPNPQVAAKPAFVVAPIPPSP